MRKAEPGANGALNILVSFSLFFFSIDDLSSFKLFSSLSFPSVGAGEDRGGRLLGC